MTRLSNEGTQVTLRWNDGTSSCFHAIWLRDNCRCSHCGEPSTGRRTLRLSQIDLSVTLTDARLVQSGSGECIRVAWSDGHQGEFGTVWLKEHAYDARSRRMKSFHPALWTNGLRENPPSMPFEEVMTADSAFFDLLNIIKNHGLCLVDGASASPGTAEKLARRIGFLQTSNYGKVMDLIADKRHRSMANDADPLKPHTDEPYRASPPGILLFHCVEAGEDGVGTSTFLDGFEAAETLKREDPEGFSALTRNNQTFRRFFDGDVDLICEFPVISTDQFGNVCGVRVNDRVAAPTCIDPGQITDYYRGMKRFLQLSEDPDRMIRKILEPGDIAIFDNHRILHGRTRLKFRGRRWLQWVQVERGDFYSTLRILSDKLERNKDARPLLRGAYGSQTLNQ